MVLVPLAKVIFRDETCLPCVSIIRTCAVPLLTSLLHYFHRPVLRIKGEKQELLLNKKYLAAKELVEDHLNIENRRMLKRPAESRPQSFVLWSLAKKEQTDFYI